MNSRRLSTVRLLMLSCVLVVVPCQAQLTTGDRALRVFNPADADALRVASNGITTSDYFSVGGPAPAGYQFYASVSNLNQSAAVQLRSAYTQPITNPPYPTFFSTTFLGNLGLYGTYLTTNREPQLGAFVDIAQTQYSQAAQMVVGDVIRQRLFQLTGFDSSATESIRFVVLYDGKVGIGTDAPQYKLDVNGAARVSGDLIVTGNVAAKYQDFAEWVPSATDLEPGTVVSVDPKIGNGVTPSPIAYDTKVAGVVSAKPGVILGEASDSKEQIATSGRVLVKVDASAGSIAVGDLLVTSNRTGYAMKSIPIEIGGIPMHRPGTIVGKALQPLAGGEGEILVLLSLQ